MQDNLSAQTAHTGVEPKRGPSWLDRWREHRSRWFASPRFRRRVSRMPFARRIARRRARELFDLCAGFVYSQILLACVKLRLFDVLAEGPRTAEELASRLALPADRARRLLQAAVSLRLVERRGDEHFGLGVLGAAVVGDPAIAAMVEHHSLLYADLADPVALLRGEIGETELERYWAYAGGGSRALGDDQVSSYSALMAASQSLVADQVLDAYPIARHRHLLDVGGGNGTFLAAAAKRAPRLELTLFDLPAVAERARAVLAEGGLSDRARAVGGDFLVDALPAGADLVSLVRVVHDHDDRPALALLRAVRRALPDDGVLLLAEPMAGTPGAEAMGDAYFGFYLLAVGSGRARTAEELRGLLRNAGFADVREVATRLPLQTRLLVARPGRAPGDVGSRSR